LTKPSEEGPVFGVGFGHDLAARFLASYGLLGADDFSARSPHSMLLSVFGRMGAAGLIGWLAIAAAIAGMTRRVFRQGTARQPRFRQRRLGYLVQRLLRRRLGGPDGGGGVWTVLGLANSLSSLGPKADDAENRAAMPAVLPTPVEPVSLSPRPLVSPSTPP